MRHHFTLKGPFALLPIAFFLTIFIGSGVYYTLQGTELAFYKVSASVAILPALVLAVFLGRESLSNNISIFLEGVREKKYHYHVYDLFARRRLYGSS